MVEMNKDIKMNAEVLTFKRWGNKSYSLFLTINRVVIISVLLITYLSAVPVVTWGNESDTSEVKMQYDLDEIEVTASRAPSLYSEIARVLSVINKQEIERTPAESVQDLLEYIAGIDVRQRGAEGVQADISIRGGTFDQTIVLLNGINITDPQTGHHNLNLPVAFAQIERIEILEGPAARVYGPNAFSGAVNIITKKPFENETQLKMSAGSFGYLNPNLSGSFVTGKVKHLLAADFKKSNGYINNTDFNLSNFYYSGNLHTTKGKLLLQLGLSEKGFGANSFYTPRFPNQYEETATLFTSARWKSDSKFHFTPVVYWRKHSDKFMLFRTNPPDWYSGHNYHLTNSFGSAINSWLRWGGGKTAIGAEFRSESILSNVLGEDIKPEKKVPGENVFFSKFKSRRILSIFLDHSWYFHPFSINAGMMSNCISDHKAGWNFFPGIDAGVDLNENLKIVTAYNTSIRMPTFTDLYYNGPTNNGNPELKPEKSLTLEGGIKLKSKTVSGDFILFHRRGKNIIDWVKKHSDDLWKTENLTQINSLGTELKLVVSPSEIWDRNWPESIKVSYFYNNQEKSTSGFISNYVLDNLKHKITASATQKLGDWLQVNLRGIFQDREGTFTQYKNKLPVGEIPYNPFWLIDSKLVFHTGNFKAYVSVTNLFNRRYYDLGNIVQPGRWLKTGISWEISFD